MLPEPFLLRMQQILGPEAQDFFQALQDQPTSGLRVNNLKITPAHFQELVPWQLKSIPWCPSGFYVTKDIPAGKHPYHSAGLFYLQEPSAMAVAEIVSPKAGELILDLAAAPGGKATHLSSLMSEKGILVCNEVEKKRTKALAGNLERWGSRQTLITNDTPDRLTERWGCMFDRVLVDAPCSGEGMFRKSPETIAQWSEEAVQGCSQRQRKLIDTAGSLVKPGGHLVYSTCTFAAEENEEVISHFIDQQPDFHLEKIHLVGSSPGRPEWGHGATASALTNTCRFWPHRILGEGHFVALLRKESGTETKWKPQSPIPKLLNRQHQLVRNFLTELNLLEIVEESQLTDVKNQIYAVPQGLPPTQNLKVVRIGLWLGTIQRERFEPSHSLALTATKARVPNSLDMFPEDERLIRYLQGHPLKEPGEEGYVLICVSGYPIGWGKRAKGIIKNAYPKGLRWPMG